MLKINNPYDYEIYYNVDKNYDIKGLLFTLYHYLDESLVEGKFKLVDDFLTGIDLNKLDTVLMVGILRTTYPAMLDNELKNWHTTRDKARLILLDRNLNVDKILQGLFQKDERT